MSSGVTFWQFPHEENAFLEFLQRTGNVVAIPSDLVDTEDKLQAQPVVDYIERNDPDQLLLGLDEYAGQRIVERVEVDGDQRLCVASATSCLVAYRRGKYREAGRLGQFNLSASWKRFDSGKMVLVQKDLGFKKWAERLIRWVRAHTPEWHEFRGYRVTKLVKEAIDRGELDIVP